MDSLFMYTQEKKYKHSLFMDSLFMYAQFIYGRPQDIPREPQDVTNSK